MPDLIELAIARHGGKELWEHLRSVVLDVTELGGPLPIVKGIGRSFPRPQTIEVFPRARRVEFRDYPGEGCKGIFDRGAVGIAVPSHSAAQLQPDYRRRFSGARKFRRWNALDGIYFFGYALVTYLSIPFILPQLQHQVQTRDDGFMVEATFPADFDTHNPVQRFFFDSTGLLTRHDYTAEVVGPMAWGSHFTSNYQDTGNYQDSGNHRGAGNLKFARNRDVYLRLGTVVTRVPVLHARLEGTEVLENMSEVPVFGIRSEGCPYVIRPSAYALLRNPLGQVAVVVGADGCFLPGGGADPGESSEQTVLREATEECGFVLCLDGVVGHAVQIAYAKAENVCWEKQSVFFAATIESVGPATEDGNQLLWLAQDAALQALSHESHRWAVRRFFGNP